LLAKVKGLITEEVYGAVRGKGFPNQFSGGWKMLNPGKRPGGPRVQPFSSCRPGRMLPKPCRPRATKRGIGRLRNQTVIDMLGPDDVIVVDLFGKTDGGTFVGDKLAYYNLKPPATGMVVDGGNVLLGQDHPHRHASILSRHRPGCAE